MIFVNFGLLSTMAAIFIAVILYYTYNIVVRPLLGMRFYKKQGIDTYYFPVIGKFRPTIADLKEHGDILYSSKFDRSKQKMRAICSNFGSDVTLTLYEPALIKEFFLHPERYTREKDFFDIIGVLEGKGVFIVEGNQWKKQRKVISSCFNFDFLKAILPEIQKIARKNFKDLQKGSLQDVHITDVFQQVTAEVMGNIFFGEKVNEYKLEGGKSLTAVLGELMAEMGDMGRHPARILFGSWVITKGMTPDAARFVKKARVFRSACMDIINQRRKAHDAEGYQYQSNGVKDMIEFFLDYKGEDGGLSNERILDEFITLYAGGTDTTSYLLTMHLTEFVKNPEQGSKLLDEINRSYNPEKEITMDELNSLEYVHAFVKETFRVNTPAPGISNRIALEDHNINDLMIKKGDIINLEPFVNLYNEDYFPDSETFNPERWLSKNPLRDPYTFTPFSAGPRNCIGQHLAMNEARIIICEFLSMYEFKVREDYKLKLGFKFMYGPVDPYPLNLTLRSE